MYKKKTEDLEKILENTHHSKIFKYMEENSDDILSENRDFMNYMNERFKEKKVLKQDVLLKADISQRYGYKLLSEEKVTRQRDVILRICYAADFTLKETQQALKLYHMETLYARDPRDAFLMVCFNEHPGNILDINELLASNGFDTLRPCGVQE